MHARNSVILSLKNKFFKEMLKCSQQQLSKPARIIDVNSYWAQGLKPPTFMIMGLAYMTSPPTFVT